LIPATQRLPEVVRLIQHAARHGPVMLFRELEEFHHVRDVSANPLVGAIGDCDLGPAVVVAQDQGA